MFKTRWFFLTFVLLVIVSLAFAACKPAATEETSAEEVVPSEEQAPAEEPTAVPTEAPPVEVGPQPGGTLVLATIEEPDTLDIYKSSFAVSSWVTSNLGGALVAKNAKGVMVPYLAKSWEISADGLTYTFHLRDDVKFHNGEPFTANDYVWTWDRCRAEGFVCPVSAAILAPVVSYEATDDYTLVLTLAEPNYYTLSNLGAYDYLQPLNRTAVEADGENYGMTTAVGVGPYILKEWVQDEKVVLERNPDFVWGPEFIEGGNTGPYYIQNLEFRILPDLATILAGLEANELGFSYVEAKDLQTVKDTGYYDIYDILPSGFTYVQFNLKNPTYQDIKVRKAFNMATDKATIVQVVLQGQGVPDDGPLSPAMIGYDEAAMKGSGLPYDLEGAKALMQEAGYTYGADGMLVTPDGQPFSVTLMGTPDEQNTKIMQMAVAMWGELGVKVEIEQLEWGTMAPKVFTGEYDITGMGVGWPDADILYMLYHSANIGSGLNFAFVNDPALDELLVKARTEVEAAAHQAAVNAAYKHIVDQAYMIPLFTGMSFQAVNKDFQGVVLSPFIGLIFSDVYYVGE